jgi:hypothetical protein
MITKKHKRMNTSFSIKIKIKNHPHSLHFLCQTPKPTLTLICFFFCNNSNPFTLNLSSQPTTISSLQTSNSGNIWNSPLHHSLHKHSKPSPLLTNPNHIPLPRCPSSDRNANGGYACRRDGTWIWWFWVVIAFLSFMILSYQLVYYKNVVWVHLFIKINFCVTCFCSDLLLR